MRTHCGRQRLTRPAPSTERLLGPSGQGLGALLRRWRDARGKSQLDLSLDTGISQRHISFIESGRSVPRRGTLLHLAEALDMPLRERNALLLATGYAAMYPEAGWDAPEMQGIMTALNRMLRQHEPFPALVMDRHWNVLLTNAAAPRFFGSFIDLSLHPQPRNMLHLMFDPAGLRPFMAKWDHVARNLLQRVRRESVGGVVDEGTHTLIAALLAYPDTTLDGPVADVSSFNPVIPLSFRKDGHLLNYFSMVTTVGSPQTITAQELRIECMFPADEMTERQHLILMGEITG